MFDVFAYGLASVLIVSAVSLAGILTIPANSKNLILLVSFSAGSLFGDSFIHLLPEVVKSGFTAATPAYLLGGIVVMFIVEKIINWHHSHNYNSHSPHMRPFVFTNLIGDGIHNFIDGLVIGGSYAASVSLGVATTLAVVFHEIPQEISDFGVLLKGGMNRRKAVILNLFSALTAVAGFFVSVLLSQSASGFLQVLLPFTIGTFIYIAGSDLIPELQKEKKTLKSFAQLASFIAGILVMYLLLLLD